MVNIEINEQKIAVQEGTTILQAAKELNIHIPHLCYIKKLKPTSACRLCVVEVTGARNLVASCSYPVSEGMKVQTDSERVLKARRMIIDLLLSDHPTDCLTCEKNGKCKLQNYAFQLGVPASRFTGEKHTYPVDKSNPFFERDYNKCILCGRCVSACQDVQISEAIDYINRGFKSKIGVPYDRGLQDSTCVFCGQCVNVCPVGALTEKSVKNKVREWELKKVKTTCPYCGCGCSLELNIKDNKIVKVTGNDDGASNKGNLCIKGKFGWEFVHSKDRLTTPLIRKDGSLTPTTWEEALTYTADKFKELKAKYGGDSLCTLSSARCTNEDNYIMQKFTRAVMQTNNIDHCARL